MRGEWLIPPLALLAVMTVSGQDAGRPVQRANEQAPVFSSAAELVVVHVTVTDRRGAYVTGLSREAFRIVEDGTPQSIDLFTGEDSPVTVGLLVDSSGSMRQGRERVIAAATAFAEGSHRNDEIFGLAFNERVRAALPASAPFTNDPRVFGVALTAAMGAQGRTAMYDAIRSGLTYVAKGSHLRRVLVLVGDGGDNASTATYDQVLKEAQASNAAIYTVGVIDPLEREADPGLLRRLAQATGGASYFPRHVNEVEDVLREITRDIRHSYTLGYVSSNSARDGGFRRIRVTVSDPIRRSLVVRARDGYRELGPSQGK
jgi:Ca-activated chloride channel family protein